MAAAVNPSVATAGILVALMGALPAGWLYLQSRVEDAPPPTTVAVEELERTPLEVAPPEVPGVDSAVSRVLYAQGNAAATGEQDLPGLAPEVVRVLVYYEATLMVPSTTEENQP